MTTTDTADFFKIYNLNETESWKIADRLPYSKNEHKNSCRY